MDFQDAEAARLAVRQGKLSFALIIPYDFSANAVPGMEAAGGRLVMYASEGNNYNAANLAKRFAAELGHQVNINLNEKRWSLVLTTATGSVDKLTQLRNGAFALNEGAKKLTMGVVKAEVSSETLAKGANGLSGGVQQLADGVKQLGSGLRNMDAQRPPPQDLATLKGGGVHAVVTKLPPDAKLDELANGSRSLAGGTQEMKKGLAQLQMGAKELSSGLNLLYTSLPASIDTPDGSARGLADSVEPALEMVAAAPNNGAGFAPNFLATSLWLGAVMTAFIFHLRRLPLMPPPASNLAKLLGKLGIFGTIVVSQAVVILLMSLFLLDLPVAKLLPYMLTLVTTSLTFLCIILALTRAFGDTGKAAALLLMVLQLSSAGGVLPVELSGGIYQAVSPYLPFTWAIKTLRACFLALLTAIGFTLGSSLQCSGQSLVCQRCSLASGIM